MTGVLFILKAGSKPAALQPFAGDYEEWIARGMGVPTDRVEVIRVADGAPFPPLERAAAVAVTGSSAMVTERPPWVATGEAWLREAAIRSVPLLGICFGHQWLAQALGGEVGYNPHGVEVGTVTLRLTEAAGADALFSGLPAAFPVQATHRQTVLRLPEGAVLLATSVLDGCQAFRWGERAWGLQFHPEFLAAMMPRFIEHHRGRLLAEGRSPARLEMGVSSTPEAAGLLARFGRLAGVTGRGGR